MNKTLGWAGSILLAFCGCPEVVAAFQTGQCALTWTFLLMWGLGEFFVLIPVIRQIKSGFLIFNYSANLTFIAILIGFKIKELL